MVFVKKYIPFRGTIFYNSQTICLRGICFDIKVETCIILTRQLLFLPKKKCLKTYTNTKRRIIISLQHLHTLKQFAKSIVADYMNVR